MTLREGALPGDGDPTQIHNDLQEVYDKTKALIKMFEVDPPQTREFEEGIIATRDLIEQAIITIKKAIRSVGI